jgi:putative peptidoglycan lipid II flippase
MSGDARLESEVGRLAGSSADRRLLRSSALVGGFTLVSRVTGFVREVLLASAFGTTSAASALVLAQTVPNLSRSLASEEVAQATLVPTLARMPVAERRREGWRLVWLSGLIATGVLTILFATIVVLAEQLALAIGPGLDDQALDETSRLLVLLAPVVLFNGCLGAGSAYLVSERRFGVVGLSAVCSNVPIVVGLLLFPDLSVGRAALLLVAGYGLQAGFLGLSAVLVRRRSAPAGPTPALDRARLYRDLKHVALIAPPIILSLGMANFSGLIDMAFGSLAGSAAPAALDKAFRLMLVPYGVFAVAIGIVALPSLAEATGRPGQFDAEVMRTVRFLAALLVPAAVALALLSDELVGLAYERGEFDAASRALTADALVGFAFALPALGLSLVGTRAWISKRRPWPPTAATFGGLLVNAGLDALLIGPLGVAGIGIATAVAHGSVGLSLMLAASEDSRHVGVQFMRLIGRLGLLVGLGTAAGVASAALLASGPAGVAPATGLAVGAMVVVLAAPRFGVTEYQVLLSILTRQPATTGVRRHDS